MSFLIRRRANVPARPETQAVDSLQQSINEMFNDFWTGAPLAKRWEGAGSTDYVPQLDLKETATTFEVFAELPGVKKEEIELNLQDNTLTLKGEKRFEKKEEKEGWHRIERSYGAFHRTIEFPSEIDEEKVRADFKDGILTVTVEKASDHVRKNRKIEIR
jgi:HSP20 family protein